MEGLCKQGSVLVTFGSKKQSKEAIDKQKKYKSALEKHSASLLISLIKFSITQVGTIVKVYQ
jgi:hypothetical protein